MKPSQVQALQTSMGVPEDQEWEPLAGLSPAEGTVRRESHAEVLLGRLAPTAGLVTIVVRSPATLSWRGGVRGHRVSPLGVDSSAH
jgi:hypothetical protein